MTEEHRARERKAITVARRRAEEVRCRSMPAPQARGVLEVAALLGPEPAPVARETPAVFGTEVTEVTGPHGRVAVVEVSGEIDLRTSPALRERLTGLADEGFGCLVIDFAGVRFCDASGLGALVAAHNRLSEPGEHGVPSEHGGRIRLARVRPAQRRLLGVTGLDRLFPLHQSVEEAVGEGSAPTAATFN